MSATLQLEPPVIHVHDDGPKLLVEWSSPWEDFKTSIRPAFARSGPRLAGEAPNGLQPFRGLLTAWMLEALVVFILIVIPHEIYRLRPYAAPRIRPEQVVYYSGDELPRTEDVGGAQSGTHGRSGGREAHHRTQTIHVARGESLASQVVDAPDLKLPASSQSVANLLAFKSKPVQAQPGPPAEEGLQAKLYAPSLPTNVIAPAQTALAGDHSRNPLALDSVIAPAPTVQSDHTLIAPVLDSNVVAPPSTSVSRDRVRSAQTLNTGVVPPAPDSHEVAASRVQMNNVDVVPPPVSAPERDSSTVAKLNMPAPSVVAPPPSADSTHDLRRLESGSLGTSSTAVIPPPPNQNTGLVSSLIGKLFGTQDVVPPPPNVSAGSSSGSARTAGGTNGSTLATNVIPPPPSVTGGGSDSGSGGRSSAASGNGGLLAGNVIPPPPSAGGGTGISGSGRKGSGLGGPGDIGSVLGPPKGSAGNGDSSGVVLSTDPGDKPGRGAGGKGSLAMSPGGGDQPGVGGSGHGSSIGNGNDSGSGLSGAGPGAGKSGNSRGSDPNARAGTSPTPGPGGAGTAPTGTPAVPGVDVRGGSTIVTLPSFDAAGGSGSDPNLPGRSSAKAQEGPAITIVATSRSGGAFDFYGKLPGDNYTVYVDTSMGTVVMQFAEADPNAHHQAATLTSPRGLRTNLPAGLPHARVVVKCRVDSYGNLRNLQVLESGPAGMDLKIMTALHSWKFRPAMRGALPVELNAILGFNIDTHDRN